MQYSIGCINSLGLNKGTMVMGVKLTVSSVNLCVDFDPAVGGNHILGDRDALFDDRVVLHAAML
jgi:hypothetical protein